MRVVVVAPDPEWPARFEEEARAVARTMGEIVLAIHHIGSTSVPGLQAKPIIDMMPVVRQIEALDAPDLRKRMAALGYEGLGEFGLPGRRYFRKNGEGGDRTHQIHAYQGGHPDIARHLAFRDYLRAHPDAAAEYGALKATLARAHPNDIEAYMDGKDAWIKATEQRALAWQGR